MKKEFLKTALVLFGLSLSSTAALAQAPGPKQGYWNVEAVPGKQKFSVVRFYNPQNQLVYEEKMEGIFLDMTRKSTIKLLNNSLQQVVNNSIVTSQLKSSYAKK
ncbi:hypothetical protein [Pontibacter sp. SGAir0037]|uniref:hypothetical protein n=1 Tax=Pontibacter sp. SGAir0037 TaxID=2571030 RepID=UPI0010CD1D34|nr:hypothetical protein [Pontibacter sp. SGAir0037]QCR23379.1 hypothetical protein C1N53_14215 [Pontibacter sp. SGAir0037]